MNTETRNYIDKSIAWDIYADLINDNSGYDYIQYEINHDLQRLHDAGKIDANKIDARLVTFELLSFYDII